jgi:hypothetical protein
MRIVNSEMVNKLWERFRSLALDPNQLHFIIDLVLYAITPSFKALLQ